MLIKQKGEKHFTKQFEGGSFSHRVLLPGRDPSRVKVTELTGLTGRSFLDISYPVDETVRIITGRVKISWKGGEQKIGAGGTYFVSAGEIYTLEFIQDTVAICVFSQAANGTLPEDEPTPSK